MIELYWMLFVGVKVRHLLVFESGMVTTKMDHLSSLSLTLIFTHSSRVLASAIPVIGTIPNKISLLSYRFYAIINMCRIYHFLKYVSSSVSCKNMYIWMCEKFFDFLVLHSTPCLFNNAINLVKSTRFLVDGAYFSIE